MKQIVHQSIDLDGTICFRLEEIALTDEEREQERLHEEARERNESWLRGQWPRLIPACLGQWLGVGGQEALVAATQEEALTWLKANHPDDPGAFVDHVNPAWKVLFEGVVPPSREPRVRIEYLGSNEELRAFYRKNECRQRNEEWLVGQWPWLLPAAMGNHVAVSNQRAVVFATRQAAEAWVEANRADDPGSLFKEVHPFATHRTYPNYAHPR